MSVLAELKKQADQINKEIALLEENRWPIITDIYVHGPETFEDEITDINGNSYNDDDFTDEQQNHFRYLVYEMKVRCEFHEDGSIFWTHINGVELPEKMEAT